MPFRNRVFLLAIALFAIACAPKVIITGNKANSLNGSTLPAKDVLILELTDIADIEIEPIAQLEVKDNGLTTNCGYDRHFDISELYASTSFTRSAASCNATALSTFRPLLSISSLASMALVPCRRTMMGTVDVADVLVGIHHALCHTVAAHDAAEDVHQDRLHWGPSG
jgi:hypothetical protein